MKTAIAVILFLNGVQIPLPSPAILQDELTWVPVRAVFQELGYEVRWDAEKQCVEMSAEGGGQLAVCLGDRGLRRGGHVLAIKPTQSPRRIKGVVYIPATLIGFLADAQLRWDNDDKALYITAVSVGKSAMVSISDILSNPPSWANKLVTITGEYTGWQSDPLSPATSQGPPVTRSDWTIRDATGSIYCTGRRAGAPISLQPYSDLGRRLQVTGAVQLAKQGFPYVRVQQIEAQRGRAGVTCYLTTDRRFYRPGDTVVIQMKVANSTVEPIKLQFTSAQTYDFAVCDAAGEEVWRWSAGKVFAQVLLLKTLGAGESYVVEERWTIPTSENDTEIPPGLYKITGKITPQIISYPHTIQIEAED